MKNCFLREMAKAGLLMSYGVPNDDTFRQVGVYTGNILKGVKPADLPLLQSIKFEFVINLQTAKSLESTPVTPQYPAFPTYKAARFIAFAHRSRHGAHPDPDKAFLGATNRVWPLIPLPIGSGVNITLAPTRPSARQTRARIKP